MMLIKFDVKCDTIVKDNPIDLTSKNSSHLIFIKQKKLQLKTIQLHQKKKKKTPIIDQKNDNKNIIKYKKDIENIAKHACYCCKTLCFAFQIHLVSKLYF